MKFTPHPETATLMALAMSFWLGNEGYLLKIWDEKSKGDLRPGHWKEFIENPRIVARAIAGYGRMTTATREAFESPNGILFDDFMEGIFRSETYFFVSTNAGIISLDKTGGSAVEAIGTEVGTGQNGLQLFLKLATIFGFLQICEGDLLILKVTSSDGQRTSLPLNTQVFREIISGR